MGLHDHKRAFGATLRRAASPASGPFGVLHCSRRGSGEFRWHSCAKHTVLLWAAHTGAPRDAAAVGRRLTSAVPFQDESFS